MLIMRSKAAIVPTYIHGAGQIWGRKQKLPKLFGKTAVVFGSPIAWESFSHLGKREAQVEIAVLEVGTGGRLDSTNVVTPLVSVISSISYDHTFILGETLTEIAGEKGGIIKPGIPVVLAPQRPEPREMITKIAAE